ncbi:MAG: hypothetical protein AB7E21_00775 [Pseudodonghicola sp.]|uniref:hypothetical protein n=1 Tax=Pseudodonghicola sp. TaxID=1969463 RepID=UPI003A96D753
MSPAICPVFAAAASTFFHGRRFGPSPGLPGKPENRRKRSRIIARPPRSQRVDRLFLNLLTPGLIRSDIGRLALPATETDAVWERTDQDE